MANMTLKQLLNSCNASNNIEITVFIHNQFECECMYEELDPIYHDRMVNYFTIDKLDSKGYRIDIAHMNIYLDK